MAVSNIDLLVVPTGSTFYTHYFVLLYMYTTDFLQFYMYNWVLMCSWSHTSGDMEHLVNILAATT